MHTSCRGLVTVGIRQNGVTQRTPQSGRKLFVGMVIRYRRNEENACSQAHTLSQESLRLSRGLALLGFTLSSRRYTVDTSIWAEKSSRLSNGANGAVTTSGRIRIQLTSRGAPIPNDS